MAKRQDWKAPQQGEVSTKQSPATPVDPHVISPIETSDRLQSIQRLVAEHLGEAPRDTEQSALHAIPVQVGGLYPISDVWYIEPALDDPDRLRRHIAQFAREIAEEAGQADAVSPCEVGLGFSCEVLHGAAIESSPFARAVLMLLGVLSAPYQRPHTSRASDTSTPLEDDLAPLLQGGQLVHEPPYGQPARISDAGLVKLFRLLRLARRLFDLEAGDTQVGSLDTTMER